MKHDLANRLVLTGTSGGAHEFSGAVEMGEDLALTIEAWVLRTDIVTGGGTWSLKIRVQGSNDLTNWTDVGTSFIEVTHLTTLPSYQTLTISGPLSCQFTRLAYYFTITGVTSGSHASLRTSLETYPLS